MSSSTPAPLSSSSSHTADGRNGEVSGSSDDDLEFYDSSEVPINADTSRRVGGHALVSKRMGATKILSWRSLDSAWSSNGPSPACYLYLHGTCRNLPPATNPFSLCPYNLKSSSKGSLTSSKGSKAGTGKIDGRWEGAGAEIESECAVCSAPATKRCSGCGAVSDGYPAPASPDHQSSPTLPPHPTSPPSIKDPYGLTSPVGIPL